jgi:outer membrane protein OmpA-like peptidoglycan-associated protein
MMTFRLLLISIASFTCFSLQAQEAGHYFFANVGGGLHNFSYSLDNGKQKGGAGLTFNAGYNYFFTPHWGLETGLGINTLQSTATLNYMTGTPDTDTDGDAYELRTRYKNWEEKQTALLLDIPLGINYRRSINEKWGWMTSAGVNLSFPMSAKYKVNGGEIATTGYYSQWNVELSDMPQHGFSTINDRFSGNATLNPAFSLYAGLGGLYKLSAGLDLYAGAYFSQGLNSMVKTSGNGVYQKDGTYNGVLNSNQVDKARMVCAGIKIGIIWHFNSKKKETPTQVEPEIIPVAIPVQPDTVVPVVEKSPEPVPEAIVKPAADSVKVVPAADTVKNTALDELKAEVIKFNEDESIQFNYKERDFSKEIKSRLDRLVRLMTESKAETIVVGHACNIGSEEVNNRIGLDRALRVKKYLVEQGIPEDKIEIQSMGEKDPKYPNDSPENRAKNRRVEIIVK